MNDEDSRSNDAPGPSRTKSNKRRSDDKDSIAEDEQVDMKVFDQKLIYHTYLTAQDLKEENESYRNIEFDADALVRISGIVKAVLTEKWFPEINSFSNIKNRGAEDIDVELLFRNNPKFYRIVNQFAKEYEGESEEEEENDGDEEEEITEDHEVEDEHNENVDEFEDIKVTKSRPETPILSKKKKSESPSHLITNYFEKEQRTVSSSSVQQPSRTPEPPLTFASSKRQATDSINETPAKISKFNESVTETQALNMIYTPVRQTSQFSRTDVSSIPVAPKPLVFQKVVQPVTSRPSFVKATLPTPSDRPKATMASSGITQKQPPSVKDLPPKQDEHDSFDDDEDFIEAWNKSAENEKKMPIHSAAKPDITNTKTSTVSKPPPVIQRRDSFFDDEPIHSVAKSEIKSVQNVNSKNATVSKPSIQKDPFDDDDDFIEAWNKSAENEKKKPIHSAAKSDITNTKTSKVSAPKPPPVIQRRDSFFDDDIIPIQNVNSKNATVSKPSIQRKDSFDDDSDIIFIEQPAQIPPTKKTNPSKPVAPHLKESNKTPRKNDPISAISKKPADESPFKMPPGAFSFE